MYVSNHVCMFETVNHHPRTGSDSLRKTFSIERFIQFFEICEGGVLLEAPDKHVCMSEVSKHVCMSPSMYVCLRP